MVGLPSLYGEVLEGETRESAEEGARDKPQALRASPATRSTAEIDSRVSLHQPLDLGLTLDKPADPSAELSSGVSVQT